MMKTVFPLSSILALRFLGLFLVLPVLSLYAMSLEGATQLLVGVVVGGYALTQAIFQVPFGTMSDKIGRKVTILIGLLIFIVGSIIAAYATDIYTLMIGRFLQGAGAIGSVIPAMISDVVKEEIRGKAMAMMGGSIAMSFTIAMIAGPLLSAYFGTPLLFMLSAIFAVIAIVILYTVAQNPPVIEHQYNANDKESKILSNMTLLRLIITGFLQKGMMTVAFVMIPLIMVNDFGWAKADLWKVYLPAIILGLLAMGPAAVFGEKKNKSTLIFLISIALFGASFFFMGLTNTDTLFIVGVVLFFVGFNMIEPLLQSMITKFSKVHVKGKALGVANSFAYLGTFIGGTAAGLALDVASKEVIGMTLVAISIVWFIWTLKMPNPPKHKNLYLPLSDALITKIKANEEAIVEWYINKTENIAVVKFDSDVTDHEALTQKLS
jgi:MFS family permease